MFGRRNGFVVRRKWLEVSVFIEVQLAVLELSLCGRRQQDLSRADCGMRLQEVVLVNCF